jgi:hypothetical protein
VKELNVRFKNGRDVLNAYWGYLSDGGLIIDSEEDGGHGGLDVGQPVSLNIQIDSSRSSYLLSGRVVRRQAEGKQVIVAFRPGEPHDMLLTEALAETDNVPAGHHRPYRGDVGAEVSQVEDCSASTPARLLNISQEGCCLRVDDPSRGDIGVGVRVKIAATEFALLGEVVWARNTWRGVRFTEGGAEIIDVVRAHLKLA